MRIDFEPMIVRLDRTESTNTYLSSIASTAPHGTVVVAREQTAGRGQRGNTWESEPGKNLTFSILLHPQWLEARRQFSISECVALSIANVLQRHVPNRSIEVKWPNDIYVGNKKLCGILIENVLSGNRIVHSIAGIGINVNQQQWHSDAPNPVSLIELTDKTTDLDTLLLQVSAEILSTFAHLCRDSMLHHLHGKYMTHLWHRNGMHFYRDVATGNVFQARISNVAPTGMLQLVDDIGIHRVYAFKEVEQTI